MRSLTTAGALLLCTACATTSSWEPIPKPWTREVIDVQRRVRVVPVAGQPFEVERPQLEPDGKPVLAWRGAGPDDRYPARSLPVQDVESILGVNAQTAGPSGYELGQAVLVTFGVVLWGLILVAIFT